MNTFIFIFYFYFFLISFVGYSFVFSNVINVSYKSVNNGLICFLGFFVITLLSYISIFFFKHGFFHNLLVHFVGVILFIFLIYKKILHKNFIINLFKISLLVFLGLFISKTNDDFPYYHLPFTMILVENKIQFGLGNLNTAYNHVSSLFFLNSTLYLPIIKHYSFNFTNIYFLIFINLYFYYEILEKKINNVNFNFYINLLFFILINVAFSRIAEYGTDLQGQFLAIILLIELSKIINIENNFKKNDALILFMVLIFYLITLKTLFIVYLIFPLIVFYYSKSRLLLLKNNLFFSYIFFILLFFLLFVIHNFINSGCLIYGFKFLCFGGNKIFWGIPIDEILQRRIWIETWAKAGATPNFRVENIEFYLSNFNWVSNWFKMYFLNKISDFLLVLLAIILTTFLTFYSYNGKITKKINKINDYKFYITYLLILFLFLIWFVNHPTIRYGGYVIISALFFFPAAKYLTIFFNLNANIRNKLKILIILTFLIFSFKNLIRIVDEFKRNDFYKFTNFPFYKSETEKFKKYYTDNGHLLYMADGTIGNYCWALPTPCGYIDGDIKSKEFFNFIFYYRE
jgi:hypothetical protein